MADQGEPSARKATRKQLEVVPTGDPGHEMPAPRESAGGLAFIERARDTMTVRRVFGDPIERDGVTVIPAAKIRGGGGGGGDVEGNGGGGFGVAATPAGAYVLKNGTVRWSPALDLNRTIFMGQVVAIVFLLTVRSVAKALTKRR